MLRVSRFDARTTSTILKVRRMEKRIPSSRKTIFRISTNRSTITGVRMPLTMKESGTFERTIRAIRTMRTAAHWTTVDARKAQTM